MAGRGCGRPVGHIERFFFDNVLSRACRSWAFQQIWGIPRSSSSRSRSKQNLGEWWDGRPSSLWRWRPTGRASDKDNGVPVRGSDGLAPFIGDVKRSWHPLHRHGKCCACYNCLRIHWSLWMMTSLVVAVILIVIFVLKRKSTPFRLPRRNTVTRLSRWPQGNPRFTVPFNFLFGTRGKQFPAAIERNRQSLGMKDPDLQIASIQTACLAWLEWLHRLLGTGGRILWVASWPLVDSRKRIKARALFFRWQLLCYFPPFLSRPFVCLWNLCSERRVSSVKTAFAVVIVRL